MVYVLLLAVIVLAFAIAGCKDRIEELEWEVEKNNKCIKLLILDAAPADEKEKYRKFLDL